MSRRTGIWTASSPGAPHERRDDACEREDFRFMRATGASMYVVGAITLLATLSLPDPDTSDHPALVVIAGLLALGGVATFAQRRYRPIFLRACVAYGILLVSALMGVTRPIEATPFFYLWPMLYAAYFGSRRDVAGAIALMWVTLAVAVFGFSNDPMKGVMVMGAGVSVTLATVVVTMLRERLESVISALQEASTHDYLTGLLNRRAFDEEMKREVQRALRTELPLALVIFDLDHFKQINDHHGHPAGDRALCDFAALLQREQRAGDTLARIGGEEFAVVLFGVGLQDGHAFAERIGRELAGLSQSGPELSVSAGVAALSDRERTPGALLVAADRALYAAKAAGRRRVAIWDFDAIEVGSPMEGVTALPDAA